MFCVCQSFNKEAAYLLTRRCVSGQAKPPDLINGIITIRCSAGSGMQHQQLQWQRADAEAAAIASIKSVCAQLSLNELWTLKRDNRPTSAGSS